MITVQQALETLFALAQPTEVVDVPLVDASDRVLAKPVAATRDQPPFPASSMDGYAICDIDHHSGARLTVIGESAAGHRFDRAVSSGTAVRIFTGGVVPEGADRVVIQEDVTRDGDTIVLGAALEEARYIRAAGVDFRVGDTLDAPRRLSPEDIALVAAMNIATVPIHRAPRVALISTGDELVMPGETPNPDQIIASNTFGLHALLRQLGAKPRLLPIARDTVSSVKLCLDLAHDADLIVTIGGASVGDHDIIAQIMAETGTKAERDFYKVAMRPGKPLMAGRWNDTMMVGLPGNPVSAMICGHVFLAPVIQAMQGLPPKPATQLMAPLAHDIPANGPREHYMRAKLTSDGLVLFSSQDSALLSVLSQADALVVRPVGDKARLAGERVAYLPLT